jgi:hypothetical protein
MAPKNSAAGKAPAVARRVATRSGQAIAPAPVAAPIVPPPIRARRAAVDGIPAAGAHAGAVAAAQVADAPIIAAAVQVADAAGAALAAEPALAAAQLAVAVQPVAAAQPAVAAAQPAVAAQPVVAAQAVDLAALSATIHEALAEMASIRRLAASAAQRQADADAAFARRLADDDAVVVSAASMLAASLPSAAHPPVPSSSADTVTITRTILPISEVQFRTKLQEATIKSMRGGKFFELNHYLSPTGPAPASGEDGALLLLRDGALHAAQAAAATIADAAKLSDALGNMGLVHPDYDLGIYGPYLVKLAITNGLHKALAYDGHFRSRRLGDANLRWDEPDQASFHAAMLAQEPAPAVKSSATAAARADKAKPYARTPTATTSGSAPDKRKLEICQRFNKGMCTSAACPNGRRHACSVPGCSASHPATEHK